MGTVPVFAPDGTLGDIPYDQLKSALAAGAKPGVSIKAPDGSPGVVPADRYQEAAQAGATILPYGEQETQHPGFWARASEDLKGLLHPSGFSPYPGMGQDEKAAAAGQAHEQDQQRAQEGRSLAYRAAVPFGESVGLNVPGMEESAKEGDIGGVMGHAAVPVAALAASEAAAHGGPVVAEKSAPLVRATVRGINKGLEKAPGTIGGTAGAALGGYLGGHVGAEVGGIAGAMAGKELLPQVRIPGEGFGLPDSVSGGPTEAPTYQAPQPGAAGSMAESVAAPKVTPKVVEQQLNQALGGKPLQPNVPLKNQIPGAKLPDGFSPLESSALKGYKYNPTSKEFETITQGGQHYVYGDVSPEVAAKFESADSKGSAWGDLRKAPGVALVKKSVNGKLVSVKPTAQAGASPEGDLTSQLQASLEQAQKAKGNPRFVYRARDVGEEGIPLSNDHAQATSDLGQAMKYAEAGQRGPQAGQIVRVDLSQLKPSDYVVKTHPNGAKWIQFTRPLTEDEVSVFAGKTAGKK